MRCIHVWSWGSFGTYNATERPIGYASRSLTSAERNYSQLEKEGYFWHQTIPFVFVWTPLWSGNRLLLALLSEHQSTSPQASARIRRWSLFLSAYEYTLKFRNTTAHQNADALSRLPLYSEEPASQTPPELVLLMDHLSESPVTHQHIKTWTHRDPLMSMILQHLQSGWPNQCKPEV